MHDDGQSSPAQRRRALRRLLGDVALLETLQRPHWTARERVACQLGPDAGRLVEALVPRRRRLRRRFGLC